MDKIQRSFIPGDKWIYFKIYTGVKAADRILTRDIFSILNNLKRLDLVAKWFFVRYNDPDFHLRVRILIIDKSSISEVINLFFQCFNRLMALKDIWKIQLDTYNRELERYNCDLIEDAESLFYFDSECIVSILKTINKLHNENYRWMVALKIIDDFLSAFSLDLQKKHSLLKYMSDSFRTEFGFNKYNSKQFNYKFRENKIIIEAILSNEIDDNSFLTLYLPIRRKMRRLIPIISSIKEKISLSKGSLDINSFLFSYIHMTLNRLFRSKHRLHELIIYDFMYRYYTSEIARNKSITAK